MFTPPTLTAFVRLRMFTLPTLTAFARLRRRAERHPPSQEYIICFEERTCNVGMGENLRPPMPLEFVYCMLTR